MATAFPFVGREKERADLLAHLRSASAGRGGLVLVGGEAGSGKTTLLQNLFSGDAALSAIGRCPGPEETPPFGPWVEVVEKLHRDLGWETDSLPPPFGHAPGRLSPYELAGALAHWFGHRGQPLVLAIEDLHWADIASLDLLRHLAAQLQEWPVLVISTYRTDELSRRHPLWHLLPEVQRAGAARILLDRFTRAEVFDLINHILPPELPGAGAGAGAAAMADLVHDRTAGLPLFVREMVDLLVRTGRVPGPESPLPQTLQQAIDSKLDRLPPGVLAVLEPAAVMGEQFSLDLLARVTEVAEDQLSEALEAATARHVIRPEDPDGSRFTFDHALFRESLLFRQIGSRRRRWHARIAAALEAGTEGDPDAIAYHLNRAGDPRAAGYLCTAGDRARALGALAQAQDRYEQALSLLPAQHPDRPEVLLKLGWCLLWGDSPKAMVVCQEALEAATARGDRAVALWARYLLLSLAHQSNDAHFQEQATALAADQEAMLADARYQRLETELFGGHAGYPRAATSVVDALAREGAGERARIQLQELTSRALPGAGTDLLINAVELALLDGRLVEAADLFARAAEIALRLRRYRGAVLSRRNELLTRLIGPADQPDELDRLAREVQRLEEEAWQQTGYTFMARGFSLIGVYLYFRGDWRGAYHHVVEAARQDPGVLKGSLAWHAGHILVNSGDPAGARPLAEAVPPLRPSDPIPLDTNFMVMAHTLRAEVYLALGDREQARLWLEAADRWPALATAPFYRANVRLAWAAYHQATGDLERAWQAALDGLAGARTASSSLGSLQAHRLLGRLAAARGDMAAADEHFRQALDIAERCRFPFEAALTRLARGQALGATPAAVADLEAASAYFSEVGAGPALAMARQALAGATARPAHRTEAAAALLPDRLTEREEEVIALVCEGLTDREIAARLFISPKTVDRHLRNIFNKTGVSNRAALAAYASRQGLLR